MENETKTSELLPCPFCGGIRVHFYPLHRLATHRSHPAVRCHQCGASINGDENDYSADAATAIAAWNRRAPKTQDTDTPG